MGNRVGIWKTLSANGKLAEESNYGETGKKTGVYKDYNLDGNLVLELTYKGEEIITYKTFDNNGKVLSEKEKTKKKLDFVTYHKNGKIRMEGSYTKGEPTGIWKDYNQYGVVIYERNYNEEGNLDGSFKTIF